MVNAQPEGTTFCFQAGTYRLAGPVLAKSRDRFLGQPGTVLDGQGTVTRGIWGYVGPAGQGNVAVQGMTFVNFTDTALQMGWYWTVSQNEMRDNQIGVVVNSYSTLDGNYIHDNRRYGIAGGPGADMLIVNNELAHNNTTNECGGACPEDAGGSKIVGSSSGTTGLVWRNNKVHDNIGHGIWSDGNVRALYERNIVSNNSGAGIFHEISWDAIIRNNTLTNNDSETIGKSCWWGVEHPCQHQRQRRGLQQYDHGEATARTASAPSARPERTGQHSRPGCQNFKVARQHRRAEPDAAMSGLTGTEQPRSGAGASIVRPTPIMCRTLTGGVVVLASPRLRHTWSTWRGSAGQDRTAH